MSDKSTSQVVRVFRQTTVYSIGGFLNKAILVLMVPLFARYISPEDYSLFELFDPAEQFLAALVILGQGQALLKFYPEYKTEAGIRRFQSTFFWFTCAIAVVVSGLLYINGDFILSFLLRRQVSHPAAEVVFLLALGSLFLRLLFQFASNLIRAEGRAPLHETMIIVGSVVYCLYNLVALTVLNGGIEQVFEARLFLLIPMCLAALWLARKRIDFVFDGSILKRAIRFGLPLVLAAAAYPILNFFDRWMLNDILGAAETGIYGMAYKFGMIPGMVLVAPFLKAWQPAIYQSEDESTRVELYRRMLLYYTLAGCVIWLGVAGFRTELMILFTSEAYVEGYVIIPWIAGSQFFYGLGWIVVAGLAVQSRTVFIGVWTMVSAIVNIALNAWLIPLYGISGAAYATVVAFFLIFAGFAVYTRTRLFFRFPYLRTFLMMAVSVTAVVLVSNVAIAGVLGTVVKAIVFGLVSLFLLPLAGISFRKVRDVSALLSRRDKQ